MIEITFLFNSIVVYCLLKEQLALRKTKEFVVKSYKSEKRSLHTKNVLETFNLITEL